MRPSSLAIAIVLVLIIIVPDTQPVYACTTPYEPVSLQTDIEESDYIVKATVIEVDDASQNAILRAERYLTGGRGPQYLLFYRVDPTLTSVFYGHHYDTSCLYGGTNPIELHSSGYYALRRLPTGAYTFIHDMQSFESRIFPQRDDRNVIEVRKDPNGDDSPSNIEELEGVSEAEFVELIAELSGEEPAFPSYTRRPRLNPLLITTASGAQYLYPVDDGPVVEGDDVEPPAQWSPIAYPDLFTLPPYCAEVGCQSTAPDRSLFAVQIDQSTIQVDYPYRPEIEGVEPPLIFVDGQGFAFSPTSESLLVWNDDTLVVYLISNTFCNCSYGDYVPALVTLAEIPLALGDQITTESLHGQAVWSADGTTLAYADAQGVWLLDIFRSDQSQLLVEASDDGTPTPLYLSTTGRYLAYSYDRNDHNWITLDRMTGEQRENAIVSPSERYIAHINPSTVGPPPDFSGRRLPMMEDCRLVLDNPAYFEWFEWQGGDMFFQVTCDDEDQDRCIISGSPVGYLQQSAPGARARIPGYRMYRNIIAYQQAQDLFAYVNDPRAIRIEGITSQGGSDLEGQLDADIVDLAWLPSLFYRR